MPRPLERGKPLHRVNVMLDCEALENAQRKSALAGIAPATIGRTSAFIRWLIDNYPNENRRYKRKRCLAMGAWCQANCMHTVLLIGHKIMPHWEWRIETNYWYKWRDRWMKLAEKFQGE